MYQPADYLDKQTIAASLYGDNARYETRIQLASQVVQGTPGQILTLGLTLLAPQPGQHILELGAGNGYFSNLVYQAGCHGILATDLAEAQLERIHQRYPHLATQQADAETIALAPNVWDAVVANFMLYHLHEPEHALRAWAQALKPGGKLLILTKGSDTYSALYRWHRTALQDLGHQAVSPLDESRWSEQQMEAFLAAAPNAPLALEVSSRCQALIQYTPDTLIAYIDTCPWSHYDLPPQDRAAYHTRLLQAAALEQFRTPRVEWAFLLTKVHGA